jgi:hypothetical protein
MQPNKTLLIAAVFSLAAAALPAATMVYNNGVSYSGFYLNPGTSEVGDEILLGSGPRVANSFQFEYYGSGLQSGGVNNEQFRVRFYQNDGAFLGSGPGGDTYLPNTVFYDSGFQTLAAPTDPSGRNTYLFDLSYTNLVLPDRFTWSVEFTGIDAGETAGVSIYDPPSVGNNLDDYWLRTGGGWELRGTNGQPINFGAQITTVPEPSTYVIAILGGLCGLAVLGRRRR